MALYTILENPNGNRYTLYLNWNGKQWNWNYNWQDNNRGAGCASAVLATLYHFSFGFTPGEFCFSLRSLGGGGFCKLSIPAPCHFPELINLEREYDIFFVIERFGFPKHHQKYFECVDFSNQYFHVWLFFFSWEKARDGGRFHYLYEERVDALAKGMPMQFRQYLIVPIPDEIGAFYFFEQWQKASGGGYYFGDGKNSMYPYLSRYHFFGKSASGMEGVFAWKATSRGCATIRF